MRERERETIRHNTAKTGGDQHSFSLRNYLHLSRSQRPLLYILSIFLGGFCRVYACLDILTLHSFLLVFFFSFWYMEKGEHIITGTKQNQNGVLVWGCFWLWDIPGLGIWVLLEEREGGCG